MRLFDFNIYPPLPPHGFFSITRIIKSEIKLSFQNAFIPHSTIYADYTHILQICIYGKP